MRMSFATAAFLAVLLAAPAVPAQPVVVVRPLSVVDVQAIAAQSGIAVFYRVRLDEGVWKVEGRDLNGQYVYMRIDPATGQIVRMDRGWW